MKYKKQKTQNVKD